MRVRNWKKHQHFKDRKPTWIKLHRDILDQRDIMLISDRDFRVIILLWLLAAEDPELKGNLPCIDDISFRLRMPKDEIEQSIQRLGAFLEQDDINLISECYQSDIPETETETETETDSPPTPPGGNRRCLNGKKNNTPSSTAISEQRKIEAENFDIFYEAFPKHMGRGQAQRAFRSALKKTDFETILDGAKRYAKSVKGTEKQFIAHPATWLNGERWADEIEIKKGKPKW